MDLRGQTSASFNMRQNYERCLFEFEDYLATGAYVADVNAGRAPSADAIVPFQPRHPIASIPVPGQAPTRHTPVPRERSEEQQQPPRERTVTTRSGMSLVACTCSGQSSAEKPGTLFLMRQLCRLHACYGLKLAAPAIRWYLLHEQGCAFAVRCIK